MEFQREMRKLDIDLEKVHADDRSSARQMATSRGVVPQLTLSVIYTVAYGFVLWFFLSGQVIVPLDQKTLFGSLLGVLTAAQIQIMNFWFGSSSGSKQKTDAMAAAK